MFYVERLVGGVTGRGHAERRGSIEEQVPDESYRMQGCRGRGKLTAGKMRKLFHGTNEKGKRNTNGINLCLAD